MSFLSKSAVYLGSGMVNKAIPFLLLPFLTKFLTPDEYGIVSLYQVILAFLVPIVGLGAQIGIGKSIVQDSDKISRKYIGNTIIIFLVNALLVTIIIYLLSLILPGILIIESVWFYSAPLVSLFSLLNMITLIALQSKGFSWQFGFMEIIKTIFNVGLSVILIYYLSMKWEGRFIGIAAATCFTGILSLFILLKKNWVTLNHFTKEGIKGILRTSLPSVPHFIAAFIITFSDRLFIEKMIGKEELGIYSVGYSIGMLMFLLTDALVRTWSPWFYKKIETNDHLNKVAIVKSIYLYIVAIVISGLLLIMIAKIIFPYVIDPKFHSAEEYIWVITVAYIMRGLYQVFYPFIININKTKYLSYATGTAAIFNICFNYILIPDYGGIGAAVSTIAAFAISFLVILYFTLRNYKMPWLFLK